MTTEDERDPPREDDNSPSTALEILALIAIVGASAGASPPRQDYLEAWTRTLGQAMPRVPESQLQEQVQKTLKALWPGHT